MDEAAPYDCKVTVAKPEEIGEILGFYEEHRTRAVYLREEADIRRSIENELFAITRNNEGQIIAASGVYILGDGKPIECIGNGHSQHGVVAELGSVLRWEKGLPEELRHKGFWHPFLFSVPMILLAAKAGKGPNQLPVDYLVADVQNSKKTEKTKYRLIGQIKPTPLAWTWIEHPGKGLVEAFRKTVNKKDTNVDNDKSFFQGSIGNLVEVAKYLQKSIREGLTNRIGESMRIDMSDLIERWTESKPGTLRVTFLDRIVKNGHALIEHGDHAWCELPRIFDTYAPLLGEPLENAPPAYHDRSVANANTQNAPSAALITEAGSVVTNREPRPSVRQQDRSVRVRPVASNALQHNGTEPA